MVSEAQPLAPHGAGSPGSSESTVDPGHSALSADFRWEGVAWRVQPRSAGLRQSLLSVFWSFLEMQVEDVGLIGLFFQRFIYLCWAVGAFARVRGPSLAVASGVSCLWALGLLVAPASLVAEQGSRCSSCSARA